MGTASWVAAGKSARYARQVMNQRAIGANIGMFAVYAAGVAHAARVFSYEPFAKSFALLRRNLEQNHATAVQAIQLGVAATRGQRTLNLYRGGARTGYLFATRRPT